jgi:hypothetical protein
MESGHNLCPGTASKDWRPKYEHLKTGRNLKSYFFLEKKCFNQSFQALLPGLSSRLLEENEASRTDPGLR